MITIITKESCDVDELLYSDGTHCVDLADGNSAIVVLHGDEEKILILKPKQIEDYQNLIKKAKNLVEPGNNCRLRLQNGKIKKILGAKPKLRSSVPSDYLETQRKKAAEKKIDEITKKIENTDQRQNRVDWSKQPLGQMPDEELAKKIGYSATSVGQMRRKQNIPAYGRTYNRKKKKEEGKK